ncbi:unnamed protein product [Hymenolepis diminuta]|uniref:Uncharacterized protein n=1 Tax=Hymenolepis diminuta TaxID=6216 RepID=A0A564YMC2_HYMDI|nr:unnamed protein product [Hymenolepis diminuta]
MFPDVDTIKEAFFSAVSTEAQNLFLRLEDVDDDEYSSSPSRTNSLELLEMLSAKQRELDDYNLKIAELQKKIKEVHPQVVEKYRNFVCGDTNLPVCHENFRKHLDSKVNHLTELMVKNREFLEKIKEQKSFERDQFDTRQKEVQDSAINEECNINAAIEDWTSTRLGILTLSDSSHVVLDASESTLLIGKEKKFAESCDRIRGQIKQPLSKASSFGFNSLHPLRGSMEDMEVAKIAVKAMTPSVLTSHLIWKQVKDADS